MPFSLFCLKGLHFLVSPLGPFSQLLDKFGCVWLCDGTWSQSKCHINRKARLSTKHEIVRAEPHGWVWSAVIGMDQCSNMILPLWLLFLGQGSKHIDHSGVESFTLTIGLSMIWTGLYFLHSHQLTEVSHQLTLKVASLICQNLFRKTIVDNELVP